MIKSIVIIHRLAIQMLKSHKSKASDICPRPWKQGVFTASAQTFSYF